MLRKCSETDHGVDLPSDRRQPPNHRLITGEIGLAHAVDLPETVADEVTTGHTHEADLPEVAAESATTGLAHAVDLPETVAQDATIGPVHAVDVPRDTAHWNPGTGLTGWRNFRMKHRTLTRTLPFQTMMRPRRMTRSKCATRQKGFWKNVVPNPYHKPKGRRSGTNLTVSQGPHRPEPRRWKDSWNRRCQQLQNLQTRIWPAFNITC